MVSIIVPTFNKLSRLKLMITSIEMQTYKGEYEVIIVNDGSTDGTEEYLNEIKKVLPIKYIVTPNSGRATARNMGIELAQGDLLIFVDDDVLLSPSFIEEHIKSQNTPRIVHGEIRSLVQLKFFEDPTCGTFYSNINVGDINTQNLKEMCITDWDIKNRFEEKIVAKSRVSTLENVIQEVLIDKKNQSDWIGFTGGNISVQKKWLDDVGRFDESFGKNWGCEDLELGYRLHKAGYPFAFSRSAVNYHMMHYRSDYKREHQLVANYFYEKHKDEKIKRFQEFVEGEINKQKFLECLLTTTM